ncbi:MAG: SCO family protein [Pseudonocardiaceae bacterium]
MRGWAVAMTAFGLAVACVAGCGTSRPNPPSPNLGTVIDRPVPAAVLDLPLTTAGGAGTSLAAYHGKIVVLGDFLTLCQEVCPMTSANFAQLARTVIGTGQAEDVVFIEATVDPERDTPARLAAYRNQFQPPSNWVLTTGKPADLAALWTFFGVFYQRTPEDSPPAIDWWTRQPLTYDVAHQDAIVFLGPDGHERFVILGNPDSRGIVPPPTLSEFLSPQGHRNLADPGPASWTVADALTVLSWLDGRQIGE